MPEYEIQKDGQDVGSLACYPDQCEDTAAALRAAGYTVNARGEIAGETQELHRLDEECSIENHEPCDLSVAAAWVVGLAEDTGTDAAELNALVENGYETKEQVVAAMEAVAARLPATWDAPDGNTVQVSDEAQNAIKLARDGAVDEDE